MTAKPCASKNASLTDFWKLAQSYLTGFYEGIGEMNLA